MKYDLVGVDGNAFSVMGYVLKAMRECKISKEEQSDYQTKAMSGDYNNLLTRLIILLMMPLNKTVMVSECDI